MTYATGNSRPSPSYRKGPNFGRNGRVGVPSAGPQKYKAQNFQGKSDISSGGTTPRFPNVNFQKSSGMSNAANS